MYGYNKYVPLNIDEVYKRATEKEIFGIVIQDEIVVDDGETKYKAPYRHDNVGDCYFEMYNGQLMFVDFASPFRMKSMNCITTIQKTYNISFAESLRLINDKLSLGLGDNLGKVREIIQSKDSVEEKNVNLIKERVITILPRQFNYKDKHFWFNNYEITRENLIEDKVIPIELYKSTSRKGKPFSVRPFDVCYAYTDFEGDRKKIYRPNSPIKEGKWFTNCNQNDVGGITYLSESGDLLIIAKSYKDYRVIKNQGLNVIWFQNEGMIPSSEILLNLLSRFKKIIVWFDNDSAGITNSRLLVEYLKSFGTDNEISSIMLPPILLRENIKDPSDYIAGKGRTILLEFMKNKELL